ncbi:MAG: hypothetical protein J5I98_35115 [Phaeodactylibacter sp.]|nr:hypothetical protein [Phaeodactylibacter sp.]
MIKDLPKAELHCHLIGVIHPKLLTAIAEKNAPVLIQPEKLEVLLPVETKAKFQRWIKFLEPYQEANWKYFKLILEYHIGNLIAQSVLYTEIMISPTMFPNEISDLINSFRNFRSWVDELEDGLIQVEFIMVMPRTLSDVKIEENTETYIELYRLGLIVGVAIVGIENDHSIQRFSKALEACKVSGLGIEVHAGEHSGPENVRDALDFGFVDRIGHGVGLFQDKSLIQRVVQNNIHLEFCLTSNLKTGSIASLNNHPLPQARAYNLSYSINTDDPGLFGCNMLGEYELLAEHFSFTDTDFRQLFENTMKARFQPNLKYLEMHFFEGS